MNSDSDRQPTESSVNDARIALEEILDILQQDSGGYESQRQRIRKLVQRCLKLL